MKIMSERWEASVTEARRNFESLASYNRVKKSQKIEDLSKEELIAIIKQLQAEIERLKKQNAQLGGVCITSQRNQFLNKRVKDAKPGISIS